MRRILVPTDFTQGALNAYTYALKLAHQLDAKLTLYHVYGHEDLNGHMPKALQLALKTKDEEGALTAFEDYGNEIQRGLNISVSSSYILEKGRPVKSIVAYADFMEADLIVMSTWWAKGASGIVDTWLGHAGTKVIEKTFRPVLLIPEQARYHAISHLAYATNFKEKDQRIPKELISITEIFKGKLSCMHVHRPGSTYDEFQFAFMREMYRMELNNFSIYFYSLIGEKVILGLNTFVEREEVDMLVMMRHEQLTVFDRILGTNIPKQMAFHSRTPFLVLNHDFKPHSPSSFA